MLRGEGSWMLRPAPGSNKNRGFRSVPTDESKGESTQAESSLCWALGYVCTPFTMQIKKTPNTMMARPSERLNRRFQPFHDRFVS